MSFITVLSKAISLPVDGVIEVDGIGVQGFAGANQWGFELWIDGLRVYFSQGFSDQVAVPFGGLKACDAGPRLIELRWAAHPSVTLHNAFLKIKGFANTAGV